MSPDPVGKAALTILLLAALTAGALISYLWVMGYYVALGLAVPEVASVVITEVSVAPQDPTYLTVSVLNPSFSPADAEIIRISVLTADGTLHEVEETEPSIPQGGYTLPVGNSEAFKCYWSWVEYAGETVKVMVFLSEGSGATFQTTLPPTDLRVTRVVFDPNNGTLFNITVENSASSATFVNLTGVTVIINEDFQETLDVDPQFPVSLNPGEAVNLTCLWTWAGHQNRTLTIVVDTLQGYRARFSGVIPTYVTLEVSEVSFSAAERTGFNVTVTNLPSSVIPVDITRVYITLKNGTSFSVTVLNPSLPYTLDVNGTVTLTCSWDWSDRPDEEVTVTIKTLQGFEASETQKTPP